MRSQTLSPAIWTDILTQYEDHPDILTSTSSINHQNKFIFTDVKLKGLNHENVIKKMSSYRKLLIILVTFLTIGLISYAIVTTGKDKSVSVAPTGSNFPGATTEGFEIGNITFTEYPDSVAVISLESCRSCCFDINEYYDGNNIQNLPEVEAPADDLFHYYACYYFGCEGYKYPCENITKDVNNHGKPHPRGNAIRGCEIGRSMRETSQCQFEPPDRIAREVLHVPIDKVFQLQCVNGTIIELPTTSPTWTPTFSPTFLPTESPVETTEPTSSPIPVQVTSSPTARNISQGTNSPTVSQNTNSPTTFRTSSPTPGVEVTKSPTTQTNSPTVSTDITQSPTSHPVEEGGSNNFLTLGEDRCDAMCYALTGGVLGAMTSVLVAGCLVYIPFSQM